MPTKFQLPRNPEIDFPIWFSTFSFVFGTFRDMAQFKEAEISDVFHDSASPECGILRTTLFFFCDVDSDGVKVGEL
jgi:hypothetical protein